MGVWGTKQGRIQRRSKNLLRQTHAPEYAGEARVGVEGVKTWIYINGGEPLRAIFLDLLQPPESLVSLA
jgi:hypothetical protein